MDERPVKRRGDTASISPILPIPDPSARDAAASASVRHGKTASLRPTSGALSPLRWRRVNPVRDPEHARASAA